LFKAQIILKDYEGENVLEVTKLPAIAKNFLGFFESRENIKKCEEGLA